MAKIGINFSQVPPDPGRGDPVPGGWYVVAAVKSEEKPTSSGTGTYHEFVFDIIDGQFQKRKLFHRFNLKNPNAQAVDIAYKQMSAFCHAVGVLEPNDSSDLHNRPLKVRVKVKAAEGDYDASNEITAFKNVNEQTDNKAAAPMATGPVVPPPPSAAAQGWAQPGQAQQPAYQPQQQAPAQQYAPPPQQQPQYAPPPQQQTAPQQPYQPQQQPQYQQPAPGGQPPAWQPPPGAQSQPWAQPQQQPQQQQPMQQPAQPSAAPQMQPQYAPPPMQQQPGGTITPPWMQQPPAGQ